MNDCFYSVEQRQEVFGSLEKCGFFRDLLIYDRSLQISLQPHPEIFFEVALDDAPEFVGSDLHTLKGFGPIPDFTRTIESRSDVRNLMMAFLQLRAWHRRQQVCTFEGLNRHPDFLMALWGLIKKKDNFSSFSYSGQAMPFIHV